jgi:hypothetical protein
VRVIVVEEFENRISMLCVNAEKKSSVVAQLWPPSSRPVGTASKQGSADPVRPEATLGSLWSATRPHLLGQGSYSHGTTASLMSLSPRQWVRRCLPRSRPRTCHLRARLCVVGSVWAPGEEVACRCDLTGVRRLCRHLPVDTGHANSPQDCIHFDVLAVPGRSQAVHMHRNAYQCGTRTQARLARKPVWSLG